MTKDSGRVLTDQALAVPATPAETVDGPAGFDPSRKELLKFARAMRHEENQRLHSCANAFVSPQPAGEDYHFRRLLAWDALISDIKEGLPADKAMDALAALALEEQSA